MPTTVCDSRAPVLRHEFRGHGQQPGQQWSVKASYCPPHCAHSLGKIMDVMDHRKWKVKSLSGKSSRVLGREGRT